MTFTDADIERDKGRNQKHRENETWISLSPDRFDALIARLEAAETALEFEGHRRDCYYDINGKCDCGNDEAYDIWRKAAGK